MSWTRDLEVLHHQISRTKNHQNTEVYDGSDRVKELKEHISNSWVNALSSYEIEAKNEKFQEWAQRFNFWNKIPSNIIKNKKFEEIRYTLGASCLILIKNDIGKITKIPAHIFYREYFGFDETDEEIKLARIHWGNNNEIMPFISSFYTGKLPQYGYIELKRESHDSIWEIHYYDSTESKVAIASEYIKENLTIQVLEWGDSQTSFLKVSNHSHFHLLKSVLVAFSRKAKSLQQITSVMGSASNLEKYDKEMERLTQKDGILEPIMKNVITPSSNSLGGEFLATEKNSAVLANDLPAVMDFLTQTILFEAQTPTVDIIYANSTEKNTSAQMSMYMTKDIALKQKKYLKEQYVLIEFLNWLNLLGMNKEKLDLFDISKEFRVNFLYSIDIDNLNPQLVANVKQNAITALEIGPKTNVSEAVEEASKKIEKIENKEQGGIEK